MQCVLNMPELKIVKPSDTRWLSHKRCLRAIRKELASLIINLDNLYEESGDAEAYGLSLVLSSFSGIASVFLLSAALDLLAKLNCFMQKKAADFSRLPIILEGIISEFKPFPTFRQLLSQPKDKVPELQRSGVVHKIPCTNCSVVYIGQTGCRLWGRLSEHKRVVRMADFNSSARAEHAWSAGKIFAETFLCIFTWNAYTAI